jgi:hypothetical protein
MLNANSRYLRFNPRGSNAGHGYPPICPFSLSWKADLDQRVRLPYKLHVLDAFLTPPSLSDPSVPSPAPSPAD